MTEITLDQPQIAAKPKRTFPARLWKGLVFFWKFAIGMLCVQSLVFSFFLVGWTYRFMQRVALKSWWKRSDASTSLDEFLASHDHLSWPNWILDENFRETFRTHRFKALFHSLWLNFRLGVAGAFNTFVLTIPGCALMMFGWYDGWNNSFNKGYEQFSVGPATSWFGILLFAIAMLYVPMAQARQAITGEWRSFYQWGLVWRLVRLRWLQSLGIAAVYALVSFPILILRAGAPYLQGKASKMSAEELMALPHEQIVQSMNQYFLWCALLILPAFLFVRWLAARNYAAGTAVAIKKGIIAAFGLSDFERGALARLNMLEPAPLPPRHILLRVAGRVWRFGLRSAAVFAIFLVWVIYVFELYICQFFHYIPGVGWLNHCLVQLPWFHFIPGK
ncbi:MAG TPA: hypothetical protein VFC26_13170 [Verrucomicrobiae bacterium]|nr:hypothetical protein [Verrucomicrobiae bacterium]